jgi:hypothetical protein
MGALRGLEVQLFQPQLLHGGARKLRSLETLKRFHVIQPALIELGLHAVAYELGVGQTNLVCGQELRQETSALLVVLPSTSSP